MQSSRVPGDVAIVLTSHGGKSDNFFVAPAAVNIHDKGKCKAGGESPYLQALTALKAGLQASPAACDGFHKVLLHLSGEHWPCSSAVDTHSNAGLAAGQTFDFHSVFHMSCWYATCLLLKG